MAGARPADQVWLDGRLVSASEPHLRVDDRGFQLGDGAFETLRARRGVVIELYEHLARLHDSTDALAIRLPFDDRRLIEGIRELLAAEGLDAAGDGDEPPGDAALRITVSRGPIARRGLLPAGFDTASATVAIQARPYAPPPVEVLARGVRAIVATVRRDPSSPLAGVKSTSRADYVHARLEADRAGADDALFLTTDGRLSEGTTANVFAKVVYGSDHPYGRVVNENTVRAITRNDIVAFHRAYFTPGHAVIVVTGDVNPQTVRAQIEKAFAGWKAGGERPTFAYPAVPAPRARTIFLVDKPNAAQSVMGRY